MLRRMLRWVARTAPETVYLPIYPAILPEPAWIQVGGHWINLAACAIVSRGTRDRMSQHGQVVVVPFLRVYTTIHTDGKQHVIDLEGDDAIFVVEVMEGLAERTLKRMAA